MSPLRISDFPIKNKLKKKNISRETHRSLRQYPQTTQGLWVAAVGFGLLFPIFEHFFFPLLMLYKRDWLDEGESGGSYISGVLALVETEGQPIRNLVEK